MSGRHRTRARSILSIAAAALILASCAQGAGESTTSSAPSPLPSASPSAASETASPSAVPSPSATRAPSNQDLPPDSVAEVVTTDLVVRSAPGISDESEIHDMRLDGPTLLFVLDGPVTASGYEWYLVQPFAEGICLDVCPGPLPFGWVARASREGEPWVAPGNVTCPERTVEAIQWVSGPVRLACFGDETIALTGKLVGCFAAHTPITLLQSGCELRPTDYVPPESFEPSGLILRFADVSLNSPANGETVTLRGRFDHEAASDCTWPDDAGLGEQEPPHPELVVLWCRMEFVITAAAQPG